MRSESTPSFAVPVVLYLLVAAIGLYALPTTLAAGARLSSAASLPPIDALLWLVGAGSLAVVGVLLAPALDQALRSAVRRSPWFTLEGQHAVPAATPAWISFPLVVILNLALDEAILRPPLSAILGGSVEATIPDALIATACFGLLILLLVRLHRMARLWIAAGAWYGLDAIVPTANSEGARRFYDTGQHRTQAVVTQRTKQSGLAPTIATPDSPLSPTLVADQPTLASPRPDATQLASQKTDSSTEATLIDDRGTIRQPDGRSETDGR